MEKKLYTLKYRGFDKALGDWITFDNLTEIIGKDIGAIYIYESHSIKKLPKPQLNLFVNP